MLVRERTIVTQYMQCACVELHFVNHGGTGCAFRRFDLVVPCNWLLLSCSLRSLAEVTNIKKRIFERFAAMRRLSGHVMQT